MAFNINTFKTNMPDVVSTANFFVTITNPRCLDGANYSFEKMSFLCETAQHPGIRIATDRINRYNLSGTSYLVPHTAMLEDTIPMNFYIPNDDPVPLAAFNYWMQQIAGVPNQTLLSPSAGRGLIPGQVRYRDEYVTEITIRSLDRSNKDIIETTLYGAYPTTITPIDLSWASEDILRLQTQITFSGIKTVVFKLVENEYKPMEGPGSPDYTDPTYSNQLNRVRDLLEGVRGARSLSSLSSAVRNIAEFSGRRAIDAAREAGARLRTFRT